ENNRAFDVADLADDHRSEMQASANPWNGRELPFEPASLPRQLFTHRNETAQRPVVNGAPAFRPRYDHLVADIVENLAAVIHHPEAKAPKGKVEKAMDGDPAELLGEPGRPGDVDEEDEAVFLDRGVIPPGKKIQERATPDNVADSDNEIHDDREHGGIDKGGRKSPSGSSQRHDGKHPADLQPLAEADDRAADRAADNQPGIDREPGDPATHR